MIPAGYTDDDNTCTDSILNQQLKLVVPNSNSYWYTILATIPNQCLDITPYKFFSMQVRAFPGASFLINMQQGNINCTKIELKSSINSSLHGIFISQIFKFYLFIKNFYFSIYYYHQK